MFFFFEDQFGQGSLMTIGRMHVQKFCIRRFIICETFETFYPRQEIAQYLTCVEIQSGTDDVKVLTNRYTLLLLIS